MDKPTSGGIMLMLYASAIILTALYVWRLWGGR